MPDYIVNRLGHSPFAVALAALLTPARPACASEANTNAPPSHFLLIDRLGNSLLVSTNEVHSTLHPPVSTGLGQQIPTSPKGTPMSDDVSQRILDSKTGRHWFPRTSPVLTPYLANLDEYGNTVIQPGLIFSIEPFSSAAQAAKYWDSALGLRCSLYQSFTMVSMTDVASGASALQYYTATFFGKWAVTEATSEGRSGWLSTEANVQLGLSSPSRTQSPQENLGTIVNPLDTVSGPNGIWMSELAWQQSLSGGKVVLLAGLVDQSSLPLRLVRALGRGRVKGDLRRRSIAGRHRLCPAGTPQTLGFVSYSSRRWLPCNWTCR